MTLTTLQRFRSKHGIAYAKSGSGPAIVLVHGVGLCADAWLHQIGTLSQTHTVYAVDMPGHGNSDLLSDKNADLEDYVDVIAQWIQSDINAPVIMMGHSMGSMIALQFASRYPQWCEGIVALNSIYRRTDQARIAVQQRAQNMLDNPDVVDRVTAPISRWFGETPTGLELEMATLCASWLTSTSAIGYARAYDIFSRNDGPLDSDLTKINVPTSFITGDMDSNSSPEMSQKMASLVPNGHAHTIAESRHMMQLTHPEMLNARLLNFIKQCQLEYLGAIDDI